MRARLGFAICLGLLIPTSARAQEAGDLGITMGYPAAVGFLYHVSDRIAVRPEFTFAATNSSSASTLSLDSTNWSFGAGASALFYFARRDNVRPYISPRFVYSRTTTTIDTTNFPGASGSTTTHGNAYSAIGAFGAQYTPNDRFGVFGEVGFGYTRTTVESGVSAAKTTANSWATRTAAGVILYF